MEKETINTDKNAISTLGHLAIIGLSTILASYIAKHLANKYPNGQMTRFAKGLVCLVIIFTFIVFALLLILLIVVLGLIIYEAFATDAPSSRSVI